MDVFESMDTNGNGTLESGEQTKAKKKLHSMMLPKARFEWSEIDANGDGEVSMEEWLAAMRTIVGKSGEKDLLQAIQKAHGTGLVKGASVTCRNSALMAELGPSLENEPQLLADLKAAVKDLKYATVEYSPHYIGDLKKKKEPAPEEMDVVAAVAFLVTGAKKKPDWAAAKQMLSNPQRFWDQLADFDARNIPEDSLKKVEPLIAKESSSFEALKGKFMGAAKLAHWVTGVMAYNKICKTAQEKRAAQ